MKKIVVPQDIFEILYARGTFIGEGTALTCVGVEDAVKAINEAFRRGQEAGSK